jgi:hypothetical protein
MLGKENRRLANQILANENGMFSDDRAERHIDTAKNFQEVNDRTVAEINTIINKNK